MNEQEYQQFQKKIARSKRRLVGHGIYLVLFWGTVLGICAYLLPQAYYKSQTNAELFQEIPSDSDRLNSGQLTHPLRDDYLEKYRFYWYEMSQSNLHYDPINLQSRIKPLGKLETYSLIARNGEQKEVVYEISERYLFDQVIQTDIRSSHLLTYAPSASRQLDLDSGSYKTFLNYLKELGQYKTAELFVSLRLSQLPSDIRSMTEELNVIHYGIDYPQSEFGYSDLLLKNQSGNDYDTLVENAVKEGVDYLVAHYAAYGHLGWEKNLVMQQNPESQFMLYDFADIQDYIAFNGVKVSSVRVVGNCAALAAWIEKNQQDFSKIELARLEDRLLPGTLLGGMDE